jgi:hypothetical protein
LPPDTRALSLFVLWLLLAEPYTPCITFLPLLLRLHTFIDTSPSWKHTLYYTIIQQISTLYTQKRERENRPCRHSTHASFRSPLFRARRPSPFLSHLYNMTASTTYPPPPRHPAANVNVPSSATDIPIPPPSSKTLYQSSLNTPLVGEDGASDEPADAVSIWAYTTSSLLVMFAIPLMSVVPFLEPRSLKPASRSVMLVSLRSLIRFWIWSM